jgi:hypothetical protein
VVVDGNVVVVVGGNVVVVDGGNVVVVVVAGKVVVVVVAGKVVVVVVVTTGSNSPLTPAGAVSVKPVAVQLPRAYVGTAVVVQPGWVLALISVMLLEPVGSASESTSSTAWIRSCVVPD